MGLGSSVLRFCGVLVNGVRLAKLTDGKLAASVKSVTWAEKFQPIFLLKFTIDKWARVWYNGVR